MISYEGLYGQLKKKGITKTALISELGISSRTIAKIAKAEKLSARTLQKIADYLNCEPGSLCRNLSDNAILQLLRDEKDANLSGGLYHELQVRMTYNSNHIEGSRLTEDQTRLIFETNTIDAGDGVPVDDILETVHHFRAIDYVIDVAEEELTEEIIKHLHFILKHDTKDSSLSWFAVGEYKHRANMVGGRETTKPKDVPQRMKALLETYNAKESVTINDVIELHAEFEYIHPFQDGNGRVGRLIALKECLHHQIIPFLIEDTKKHYYYRGLAAWRTEKGRLIVKEMTELMVLDMVRKGVVTRQMTLTIGYDRTSLVVKYPGKTVRDTVYAVKKTGELYKGKVGLDYYGRPGPRHAHGTGNIDHWTSSTTAIMEAMLSLYDRITDKDLFIRRIGIAACNLIPETDIPEEEPVQLSLFVDHEAIEQRKAQRNAAEEKERRLQKTTLDLQARYGKNIILKGMNFLEGGTTRERNEQIGGHRSGKNDLTSDADQKESASVSSAEPEEGDWYE